MLKRLAGVSSGCALGVSCSKTPVAAEERSWRNPTYVPPARLRGAFADLSKRAPDDDATRLASAVRDLDVDQVKEILEMWPHGATLIDQNDDTLFHLAASQTDRCRAQPESATELFSLLLQNGWQVVDLKNKTGERAELVAKKTMCAGSYRPAVGSTISRFSGKAEMGAAS